MNREDFILVIDKEPFTKDLTQYFANFKIKIFEISNINLIHNIKENPLAILIDWTLIHNNLDYVHTIFQNYFTPLIIMNKEMDENICIKVLEIGADDYIVKPLQPRELHARISAIARRITNNERMEFISEKEVFIFDKWRVNPKSRQIFDKENHELMLSSGEYVLLIAFLKNPQKILSREFLSQIAGTSYLTPFDRRIDVQISRLRQKIEKDAKNPEIIKTIRNEGYLFTSQIENYQLK